MGWRGKGCQFYKPRDIGYRYCAMPPPTYAVMNKGRWLGAICIGRERLMLAQNFARNTRPFFRYSRIYEMYRYTYGCSDGGARVFFLASLSFLLRFTPFALFSNSTAVSNSGRRRRRKIVGRARACDRRRPSLVLSLSLSLYSCLCFVLRFLLPRHVVTAERAINAKKMRGASTNARNCLRLSVGWPR